jgi:hypothetical protein
MYRNLFSKQEASRSLVLWPKSILSVLNQRIQNSSVFLQRHAQLFKRQESETKKASQAQEVEPKVIGPHKATEPILKVAVIRWSDGKTSSLKRVSKVNSKINETLANFLRDPVINYTNRQNLPRMLQDTCESIKRVTRRFFNTEDHRYGSSLSYVFTNWQQDFISVVKSSRQIEENEWVERIKRQVYEEGKRLEKKFSTQVASPGEITDQVYNQLTRRLQVEKERLGY